MPYEFIDDESSSSGPFVSSLQEAQRHTARTLSNLGTRAVGLPGDVFSLINEYIARPISESLGQESMPYEETFFGKAIPTTETHRKGLQKIAGDYLSPHSDVEKFVDDIVEDTALLFTPAKGVGRFTKSVRTPSQRLTASFLKATGANLLGEAVRDISENEQAGEWTKLGALFFTSIFDTPAAARQISNLYTRASEKLPAGASISAKKLNAQIEHLKHDITKGRPSANLSPSEKFVMDEAEKIEALTGNGTLDINQAWAQKRSLNENLSKHVYESKDRKASTRAKAKAKQLNKYLSESIKDYGKKNPEFYKDFSDADEAFGALSRSQLVSRFVEDKLNFPIVTHGLVELFGNILGTAIVPYSAGKVAYQISKSKFLRKLYTDSLKAAAKEDALAFNKSARKLDEALQEEESQEKYEFVD